MPLSTISWTKPVTSKLRKKSLRHSATHSQRYGRDSGDRWSLVSASEFHRAPPFEEFVEVGEGVDREPSVTDSTSPRNRQASGSATWSSIDVEPSQNDVEPDAEYDHCLVHPPLASEPQGRPEVDHLVDYRGARSYWKDSIDLHDLGEQIEKLKLDHTSLCGASRELFEKQENQLHDLQNARWEIAACQDEVEKRIGELKRERAQMQELGVNSITESAPKDGEREKTTLVDVDHETIAMLRTSNVRDFAIVNNIGQAARRNRIVTLSRAPPQVKIEHLKTNLRKDFPCKTVSFVHREVEAIYRNGVRVGWNHKHKPSHKREQAPRKPTCKSEVLIEIGRLPVSERMEALSSAEKFPNAVSNTTRKRETRWFTARTMADLLNESMVLRDDRHDSVAEQS